MKKKGISRFLAWGLAFTLAVSSVAAVPNVEVEAAVKSRTVTNQSQLNAALKDKKIGKITIKTSQKASFTIKKGTYSKKTLVVKADKATITNAGKFKSMTIEKAAKVNEKADANKITVTDSKLTLNVKSGADKSEITVAKKNASLGLVADGKVSSVTVNKDAKLSVTGKSKVNQMVVNADNLNLTIGKNITVNNIAVNEITAKAPVQKGHSMLGAGVFMFTKKINIDNRGGSVKAIVLAAAAAVNMSGSGTVDMLTINSDSADVKVAEGTTIANVEITKDGSSVGLDVSGEVTSVDVKAKSDVSISGSTEKAIAVSSSAEGVAVRTKVPVDVSASATVKVTLDAGAEGSKITTTTESAKVEVSNNSAEKVEVKTPNGSQSVESGKTGSVTDTPANSSGDQNGNTSGGGGYAPSTPVGQTYKITYEISEQAKPYISELPSDLNLPQEFSYGSKLTIPVPQVATGSAVHFVWAVEGYVIDANGMVKPEYEAAENITEFETDLTLKLYALNNAGDTNFKISYDLSAVDALNLQYTKPSYPDSYKYGEGTDGNDNQIRTPNDFDGYYVTWEMNGVNVGTHTWIDSNYVGDVQFKAVVTQTDTVTYTVTGSNISANGDYMKQSDGSYVAKYVRYDDNDTEIIPLWIEGDYTFTKEEDKVKVTKSDGSPVTATITVQLDEPDSSNRIGMMLVYVPTTEGNLKIEIGNVAELTN